jgi:leader peptidase (prepilin peptidase)/N-methyltransferase
MWAAFGGLLGSVVGSYLATIVVRWPRGEAARGRSRCDGCERVLSAFELVPLLSFLTAEGRCRRCGAGINRRHFVIEVLAAAIGVASLLAMPGLAGLAGATFGWLLLALAALDLDHFWLPDRLTGMLSGLGLLVGLAGLEPFLGERLIGGLAGFASLRAIGWSYRRVRGRDGLGAGDAKLLGAIGLWLGWRALPFVLLAASLIGVVAVLALGIAGRSPTATTRMPFGTLLAAAAWPLWLATALRMVVL